MDDTHAKIKRGTKRHYCRMTDSVTCKELVQTRGKRGFAMSRDLIGLRPSAFG